MPDRFEGKSVFRTCRLHMRRRGRAAMMSLALAICCLVAGFAHAGTATIGRWVVITNDKGDDGKDIAAVAPDVAAAFGLGVRCIDRRLTISLLPLKADRRNESVAGAAISLSAQSDDGAPISVSGVVQTDRSILLSSPAQLLALMRDAKRFRIESPDAMSIAFDINGAPRALADIARQCPPA